MPAEYPVTLISVTHNSAAVVGTMLASVPAGVEAIVVDNASSDDTRARVAGTRARLIAENSNHGFGRGCNIGARQASREFLFFLNPDATIGDGAIDALLACAHRNPATVAFNPLITDDRGTAVLRAPSRFLAGRQSGRRGQATEDHEVDVLSGAALFCRRDAFQRIGGFDERIFLYFEDDDLSLRLITGGGKLMHVAAARIRHHQGTSTAPEPSLTRLKNYHWMRSYRYVAEKHRTRFPISKITVQSALHWTTATLSGRREERAKHAGRLAGLFDPIRPVGGP